LNIDWSEFENTSRSLSEIKHEVYEVDLPVRDKYGDIFLDENESGTRMVLLGLKDEWNPEFVDVLENELRLLISPYKAVNDFSVSISTIVENSKETKSVDSQDILRAASWTVKSSVDRYGRVKVVFENNKTGEVITQLPINWNEWIKNQGEVPTFGPLSFEFYFVPRDLEQLKKVNLKARDWKKFMDQNRGIRIYRDDFRVRPYGEPSGKGDWLDLGYRKARNPAAISQGNWNIGPHQVMGAVLISRETNSILDDQANREGIVENEAFYQLRTYLIKVISLFEELIHKDEVREDDTDLSTEYAAILNSSRGEVDKALESLKELAFTKKPLKKARKKLNSAELLNKRIVEFEKAKKNHQIALDNYASELKKEKGKLEKEKDILSNLASVGILTVCFGHEIRQHSALALQDTSEVIDMIDDERNGVEKIDYDELIKIARSIKSSIKYVDDFSSLAINNIKPDKRKRVNVNVFDVFSGIFKLMHATFAKMGINYKFNFINVNEKDVVVKSFIIDWESIIINFVTNSFWAMQNTSRNERIIEIDFERQGNKNLLVRFRDSGCGLESSTEESIFLPMTSYRRDLTGNEIGTGMGLAIVRTHVVEHMSGKVLARAKSSLGGAEFEICVNMVNA
ncbi:ATP-binding protein, partial [Vibrio splendidus]